MTMKKILVLYWKSLGIMGYLAILIISSYYTIKYWYEAYHYTIPAPIHLGYRILLLAISVILYASFVVMWKKQELE
jgi:hypothetical protein